MPDTLTATTQHKTWRQRAISILKLVWVIVALSAFGAYIWQNTDALLAQFRQITAFQLIIATGLLLIGRLLIVVMTRLIVRAAGYDLSYQRLLYMMGTSELAKYLPGGIWHFVGRAGYYHNAGISPLAVTRFLLLENLWLVASAGLTGSGLLIIGLTTGGSWLAIPVLIVIWMALALLSKTVVGWRDALQLMVLQVALWLLLGMSFTLIASANPISIDGAAIAGAFVISWMIGFVSLFAPGGIGVREAALVALLLPIMPPEQALALSVLHRFIWILVELLLGLYAWIFLKGR